MIKKLPQRLVTFTDKDEDIKEIEQEIAKGWNIVSIVANGKGYVCVLEQEDKNAANDDMKTIYIPPRKKIKISG